MSESTSPASAPDNADQAERHSALFAQMVLQQANMAMMLLGKVPHPQSGETVRDIEAAGLFIDQLEMLEAKTRGNLTPDEQRLLRQSLMSLQMAFVESVESAPAETQNPRSETKAPDSKPAPAGGTGDKK